MLASDVDASAREPRGADDAVVARDLRDLEAAVAVEERRRRAVRLHALRPHDEVRDLRAVLRRRLELLGRHSLRVEERRHRLDLDGRGAVFGEPQRLRRREVLVREEEGLRLVARGRQVRGADPGRRDLGARPAAVVLQRQRRQAAAHVVERLEQHAVARAFDVGERDARARLEQHVERCAPPSRSSTVPASSDPSRYVLPPTVQSLRREKRSRSRKKSAGPGVLGQVQPDEPVADDRETSPRGRTRASA